MENSKSGSIVVSKLERTTILSNFSKTLIIDLAKTALNIRKGQNVINFGSQQISISILYCWYYSEHIVELFLHDEALIFRVEPGILNTWTNLFSFCNFTSNDFSMIYSFLSLPLGFAPFYRTQITHLYPPGNRSAIDLFGNSLLLRTPG